MNPPSVLEPNHRILVIDDNKAIHDDLRKVLIGETKAEERLQDDEAFLFGVEAVPVSEFEIDSAYQGQEGLAKLEQSLAEGRPYALAFVDVRMPPGWDGVETITRLWKAYPHLQTVICTAYSDYSWTDIQRRLGTSENLLILKKPFDNIEVVQLACALTKKWMVSRQASARMEELDRMVALRTAELQKAEEAFRVVFEASPISIALSDMNGRYLDANGACGEVFGAARDAIAGRDAVELGWLDSRETLNDLGRALASFGGVDAREVSWPHPRLGDRTHLLWLRDVTIQRAPHILWFWLDITDRKKMEEDLQRARMSAEASERAKSRFLANMSHEIRTPLNGLLGLSAALGEDEVSPETRSTVRLIRTSGEMLAKILDDVLDFSKIESGKLELEKSPFSLRGCLEWAVNLFQARAKEKHIAVRIDFDERIPGILLGDPTRISQVAMNLIGNAIKFTEEGSVTVRASLVDEGVPEGDRRLRVQVIDTGVGIPADKMDRLFRAFSQVDASTNRRYGGTGLGLAICSRLVSMMGGAIGVTSKPGEGSTFAFEIPALTACGLEPPSEPTGRAGASCPEPRERLRATRVLVAEDNEVNQLVCRRFLQKLGCSADFVSDGVSAIERVREGSYDVVLMDVQMPGTDGLEAARHIRGMASPHAAVPIVALTASETAEDREACLAAGMNDYLSKPLDLDALRRAIERWRPGDNLT